MLLPKVNKPYNEDAKYEDANAKCWKIFEEVHVKEYTIEQLIRLGKTKEEGKVRPLLVRMWSEGEKWAVLSLAKNLKSYEEPMSKVFVNRGISREERERDNKLMAGVAEKRKLWIED